MSGWAYIKKKNRIAKKVRPNPIILSLLSLVVLIMACGESEKTTDTAKYQTGKNFPVYGGNKAGNRYSPLDQITLENVKDLEVAWIYNTKAPGSEYHKGAGIQCQPIVIDGILYGTTQELELFALDAATGGELWKFTPPLESFRSRGVTYWEDGEDKRIFYTVEHNLFGVNATTGELIPTFGDQGTVDLHEGLSQGIDKDVSKLRVRATSPGIIFGDIYIIGSTVSESGDAAPGSVRAFDVRTGELKWVFRTIPHPGEEGYETWPPNAHQEIGGANSWAGMVLDEQKGVVFFGTGSPSSDFYGGSREGKNLFANCIVALNARDGSLKWYYQTIHHDLWDRDIPLQPNLATIEHNGKPLQVVVQATKDGLVYVLDSETGESIFPVEERPVPTDGLPGEKLWPTQKYPSRPEPFSRQVYTEDDISDISPEAYEYTKGIHERYKTDHKFAPPSTEGTLLFGYSGGAEWGGNAMDKEGILYQNSNDNPWILEMVENVTIAEGDVSLSGKELFGMTCAACHGANGKGNGTDFPDISDLGSQYSRDQVADIIVNGTGRMPSFRHLKADDVNAVLDYLMKEETTDGQVAVEAHDKPVEGLDMDNGNIFGFQPAYIKKAWIKLFDEQGYPGINPPWGTLNAIDLNTGEYLWRVPLGEYPELTERGIPITGTESYGGPVVTASGLIFIAGTLDERIRAFDKNTGKVVWEYQLPAGGFATPATYEVDGKQYVVIAAGGGRGQKPGGHYIAFALKNRR